MALITSFSIFILVLVCYMVSFSVQNGCDCENSIIMTNNKNGSIVVQAVIDKVDHLGFTFKNDHSFIRRLAYIETRDGTQPHGHGGIWAMNQAKLNILNNSYTVDEVLDKINTKKCVQIDSEKLVNETYMTLPLYSGLAAKIYLEYLLKKFDDDYMSDIDTQAHLWFEKYHTGNLNVNDYKRIVNGSDLNDKKALNGIGSDVVENVIEMIDSWWKFSDDHDDRCLMRRIALVETNDGLSVQYNCGGIWAMDGTKLSSVHDELNKQPEKQPEWQLIAVEEINKSLCLNGINDFTLENMLIESNMHKPLYSGLAARFYLEQQTTEIPNIDDIYGQAIFWFENYHPECGRHLTAYDFVTLVEGRPVDETLMPNASGSEVVEAVLIKIDFSQIFDPDHRFMKRLAYVETKYGTENHTFHYGGIWGVNYDIMNDHIRLIVKGEIESEVIQSSLINITMRIEEAFGIDIISVVFNKEEMNVPLYNGLAAHFYLYYVSLVNGTSIPLAGNIRQQAEFWITYYHSDSRNLTSHNGQYFIDQASVAEDNEGRNLYNIINNMY